MVVFLNFSTTWIMLAEITAVQIMFACAMLFLSLFCSISCTFIVTWHFYLVVFIKIGQHNIFHSSNKKKSNKNSRVRKKSTTQFFVAQTMLELLISTNFSNSCSIYEQKITKMWPSLILCSLIFWLEVIIVKAQAAPKKNVGEIHWALFYGMENTPKLQFMLLKRSLKKAIKLCNCVRFS